MEVLEEEEPAVAGHMLEAEDSAVAVAEVQEQLAAKGVLVRAAAAVLLGLPELAALSVEQTLEVLEQLWGELSLSIVRRAMNRV
jgi:hypothetical protein